MTVVTSSVRTPRSGSARAASARPSTAGASRASAGRGYQTSRIAPEASSIVARPWPAAGRGPCGLMARTLQGVQRVEQRGAGLPREDRDGPAGEVDVEVLADVDLELAAVEHDGHRRVAPAQDVGDRRPAGAGPRRGRLPHAALEDPGADPARGQLGEPRDVRAPRELRIVLDRGADGRDVERLE